MRGMRQHNPTSENEPVEPGDMDPNKKPKQEKGLDPSQSSRTPATEPPKDKRIDDL
jgi:hypothetical protein